MAIIEAEVTVKMSVAEAQILYDALERYLPIAISEYEQAALKTESDMKRNTLYQPVYRIRGLLRRLSDALHN